MKKFVEEEFPKEILNGSFRNVLINKIKTVQVWECAYCKTINNVEKEKCVHCGAPRRIKLYWKTLTVKEGEKT